MTDWETAALQKTKDEVMEMLLEQGEDIEVAEETFQWAYDNLPQHLKTFEDYLVYHGYTPEEAKEINTTMENGVE